jgi:hypothetical protein
MVAAMQAGAALMTVTHGVQAQVHAAIQQGLHSGFPITGAALTVVPEPSGMLLLGIALSGLAVARLRAGKQTA